MRSSIAASVYECVNAAERLICGRHAVESPARAEGLAAAGQRASNLLRPASGLPHTPSGPWVYHRISDEVATGIELVATSAQEAVDHCLVAHLLAESTGEPVTCRLPTALASQCAVVTLPSADGIETVLAAEGVTDLSSAVAQAARILKPLAFKVTRPDEVRSVRMRVQPDTRWGRHLLLNFIARIADAAEVHLVEDRGSFVLSHGGAPADLPPETNLLVVCGPIDEMPARWEETLAAHAIVLHITSGDRSGTGWQNVAPALMKRLRERQSAWWHYDASTEDAELMAALVQAGGECIKHLHLPVPDVGTAQRPRRLSLDELVAQAKSITPAGLHMPAASSDSTADVSSEIRAFHRRGEGCPLAAEPLPGLPLLPAALNWWATPSARDWPFPIVLPDAVSLHELLSTCLDGMGDAAGAQERLRGELWRICRHVLADLESDETSEAIADRVGRAARLVIHEFETGDEGRHALESAVSTLVAALPKDGRLLGAGPSTLLEMYVDRLQRRRRPALNRLCAEARSILVALEGRLEADRLHSREGKSSPHLEASSGVAGTRLLDLEALSKSLPAHRGSETLTPESRTRLEAIVATLQGFLRDAGTGPDLRQVDQVSIAVGLFDGLVSAYLPVFRAMRAGRLEAEGAYDAALHARALQHLDWTALTENELEAMPRVVVVLSEASLQQASLETLSGFLQSGRPVHALVHRRLTDGEADADTLYPGLSYVSIAHREAYVFQGLLAETKELIAGLDGMMHIQRPAVAFVGTPGRAGTAEWHWLRAETARWGRAIPLFRYDPQQGVQSAHRFDLSHNPQADRTWPVIPVDYTDASGAGQTMEERFTFAHAAALEPDCRRHFRLLPPESWADDQWPVADYLDAMDPTPPDAIPYLWVADAGGEMRRAVITRELALRCRDRMRFWTLLQELAGINNAYVRAAVQRANEEADARVAAVREELEQVHAEALEAARAEESVATIDRLVTALMQGDVPSAPTSAPPPERASPPAQPAPDPEPDPEPAAPEEEEIVLDEPYIETIRCTTCDECTQLNPRMFVYNEDKQAILADLDAGTFADLVIAAEKCPADCIFPGVPRNGDPTATEDMLKRARDL